MSAYIAKSKDSTSVRYNSNSVCFDSVFVSSFLIFSNNLARFSYTRCVSKSKVFSCSDTHLRSCFELSVPFFMKL